MIREHRDPEEADPHDVELVRLLGPVQVLDANGAAVPLSGPRTIALIARLALAAGACVPAEALLNDIWEAELPDGGVARSDSSAWRTKELVSCGRMRRRERTTP